MKHFRKSHTSDDGVALITAVLGIFVVALLVLWVSNEAVARAQQSAFQDDNLQAFNSAEAALDRYRSKLIDDPLYYAHFVDATERSRVCSDPSSGSYAMTFDPGDIDPSLTQTIWPSDCTTWTYTDPPGEWIVFGGMNYRIEVTPLVGDAIEIRSAARDDDRPVRFIDTIYRRRRITDFVRLSSTDLISDLPQSDYYGDFYAAGDCKLTGNSTHMDGDYFCEGDLTFGLGNQEPNPTMFSDDHWCYDGPAVGRPECEDVRTGISEPIDFNGFWDDFEALEAAACFGGGLCLNGGETITLTSGAAVTLPTLNDDGFVRLVMLGSQDSLTPRLQIWTISSWPFVVQPRNNDPYPNGFNVKTVDDPVTLPSSGESWALLGEVNYPANGAIYSEYSVVMGWCGKTSATSTCSQPYRSSLDVPFGLYVGDPTSTGARHILVEDSIKRPVGGTATMALMASGTTRIMAGAMGAGTPFVLQSAVVTQGAHLGDEDQLKAATGCFAGTGGVDWTLSGMVSGAGEIVFYGNEGCANTREVTYDDVLSDYPPPWIPVLSGAGWDLVRWSETSAPDWAKG